MADRCLLYYITDRSAFSGDENARSQRLLAKIAEAARADVDYIQLREKDLTAKELATLAREAVRVLKQLRTERGELRSSLLINSRSDVAFATGADGVHLQSEDVSPEDVRGIWKAGLSSFPGRAKAAGPGAPHFSEESPAREPRVSQWLPLIGVSCHAPKDVARAAAMGATFAVFAPVFEKKGPPETRATGLNQLRDACQARIPVFALGGVTVENARSCLEAGAAGIAAIRLFQENDVAEVVRRLRGEVAND